MRYVLLFPPDIVFFHYHGQSVCANFAIPVTESVELLLAIKNEDFDEFADEFEGRFEEITAAQAELAMPADANGIIDRQSLN